MSVLCSSSWLLWVSHLVWCFIWLCLSTWLDGWRYECSPLPMIVVVMLITICWFYFQLGKEFWGCLIIINNSLSNSRSDTFGFVPLTVKNVYSYSLRRPNSRFKLGIPLVFLLVLPWSEELPGVLGWPIRCSTIARTLTEHQKSKLVTPSPMGK